MQSSIIPAKFTIPWANGAGPGFVRTIPTPSQIGVQAGAASFTDGFPPVTFTPVASGGVPPFGQDANGILRSVTQWQQWSQAGGAIKWDSAFSAAVGGYPAGAVVESDLGHALFESTVENNTSNPNTGGAGWITIAVSWSTTTWFAGGSANIQTVALNPAPTNYSQLVGVHLTILSQGTNTGGQATLNVNGLGAKNIWRAGLSGALGPGTLAAGNYFTVVYDGTQFQLIGSTAIVPHGMQVFTSSGTFTVPNGVLSWRLRLWGDGAGGGGSSGAGAAGSGGGAGGYGEGIFAGIPGATASVVIGPGGAGGTGSGNGVNGTGSSVTGMITCGGGFAGFGSASGGQPVFGLGGTVGGGTINQTGQQGGPGISISGTGLGGLGGAPVFFPAAPLTNGTGANGAAGGGGTGGANGSSAGRGGQGLAIFDW